MKPFFSKYKRLLAFALLLFIGVSLLTAALVSRDAEEAQRAARQTPAPLKDTHLHKTYAPDADKDPFIPANPYQPKDASASTDVSVNGVSFQEPVDLSHHVQENTGSELLGVTDRFTLFKAFGNIIYVYDKEYGQKRILDENGLDAKLSPDGEYAVILSTRLFRTPELIAYDLSLGRTQAIAQLPYNGQFLSLTVAPGGEVFYTFRDASGKTAVRVAPLPHKSEALNAKERAFSLSGTSGMMTSSAKSAYTILLPSHTLHPLNFAGSHKQDAPLKTAKPIDHLTHLSVNDAGEWLAVYFTKGDQQLQGATPRGELEGFLNLFKAEWYDQRRVLLLDTGTLYLYDLETKKKDVLKTDVMTFYVKGADVYVQTNHHDLFVLRAAPAPQKKDPSS